MQQRKRRIEGLRRLIIGAGLDALYITNPENRFYLSGFSGTAGALLLCRDQSYLLTDFRYIDQVSHESPGFTIIEVKGTYADALFEIVKEKGLLRLGCEGDHLTYNQFVALADKLKGVELRPSSGQVEGLRLCKDDSEVRLIKEAVRIASQAFLQELPGIKPGVTEQQVALRLEYTMRQMGAGGAAFKIIVASGARSAMPHGVASTKVIREGDIVTLDFGAVFCGYHSDITRTVVVGWSRQKLEDIYQIVLEAQMKAIAVLKAGVRAADVDRAARGVIESRGYGPFFGHSTGHGLGLNVHENPSLSVKNDAILQAGMVVTVEPGIYLPGWGGVRIEDTVLVEERGCKVLSELPKMQLTVLK